MKLSIDLHTSWLGDPATLGRILGHLRALESPRQAGDDPDDGLAELTAGMDAAPATPAGPVRPTADPAPAARPFDGAPTSGQGLYKFATRADLLKRATAWGKSHGAPKMLTTWSREQVEACYQELIAAAPVNGRHR